MPRIKSRYRITWGGETLLSEDYILTDEPTLTHQRQNQIAQRIRASHIYPINRGNHSNSLSWSHEIIHDTVAEAALYKLKGCHDLADQRADATIEILDCGGTTLSTVTIEMAVLQTVTSTYSGGSRTLTTYSLTGGAIT